MACRQSKPKRELVRLVRGIEGLAVDPTGRAPGRGAYLCRDPACWRVAEKKRSLERALGGPIRREDWPRLSAGILNSVQATSIIP
ncbi:MAG TPA: YlxR family protein [Candidatus Eisenbacteria bacterium]|nr:YlxR family protein [Candidatus Eisenbacteria bacterium]